MVERPRILDDLAGVAGGALSALAGIREELEAMVRARIDEALRRLALVRREELDALTELAANARAGQEAAEARLAALEARVAALETAPSGDTAKTTPADTTSAAAVGAADGTTNGATAGPANEAPSQPAV